MGIDAEPLVGSAAKIQYASSRLPTGGQEARQALKADIDRRVQELVTLKRRFNADVCAILLPDELLLEIFLYYLAWWKVTYSNKSFFRSYMPKKGHHGWVIITHVCHRWRVLALSAPLLWTDIKINRQSLTIAFLARSQQAPLSIQCRVSSTDAMKNTRKYQVVKAALGQAPRIRSLHFQYCNLDPDTGEQFTAEPDMGRYDFPQLRCLSIMLESGHESTPPSFIARGSFPVLEELDMRMYDLSAVQLVTASASHLTRLSLTAFNSYQKLSWATFFDVFASLSRLEVLTLLEGLPPVRTLIHQHVQELPSFNTILTFPALKMLSLTCSSLSCATLLRHMSFPVTTKVRIEFGMPFHLLESEHGSDFRLVTPVISSCMSGAGLIGTAEPTLSVSVDTMIGFDMRICAWRKALPIDCAAADPVDPSARGTHDEAFFHITFRAYTANAIMTRFCRALPFSSVQSLFVGELRPNGIVFVPTRKLWIECFGYMTKVTHLAVYERSTRHLAAALQPVVTVRQPDGRPEARALFPEVKVLKFQYAVLTNADVRDWGSHLREGGWRVKFRSGGEARQATVPTKLRKLLIRKATCVDAQHVGLLSCLLSPALVEVDWDGTTHWDGPVPSRRGYPRNMNDFGWVDDMNDEEAGFET